MFTVWSHALTDFNTNQNATDQKHL